jgi:glyoxylase I family protein
MKVTGNQMMKIESVHHVALTVSDLERSRQFYREVLGLEEIARPPFNFPGAWFAAGAGQQVHLIVHTNPTFRTGKSLDTRDSHFALRVASYRQAAELLHSLGYRDGDEGQDEFRRMILHPHATAGFPQIYILDPDRHIIEINAAALD